MIYVDNKYFHKMLVEYKETGSRKAYNEIGKIFLMIAQRWLNKSNFINYSDDRKEEMIGNSVLRMCKNIDSFNLEKKDPFGYFTEVTKNEVLQFINKQNDRDKLFVTFTQREHDLLRNKISERDFNE